jgi:hypothetical protein
VPPTTAIDAVSHWTLYAAPIIDFFVSSLCLFSPCMKMYLTSSVLLTTWTFLVGQQEICLILVLFAAGNMASILEVDDNMGHTFIQVNPFP